MVLPHKFYTKAYDNPGWIRQSFINDFEALGWKIIETSMIWKLKTFEEYLTNK